MNDDDRLKLPVTLTMADGRHLIGDLVVNLGGTLERTLNNDSKYVLFRDMDTSERMIAKTAIIEVQSRKKVKIVDLPQVDRMAGGDPYSVLGIDQNASDQEIRSAYLLLAKAYHADRFAKTPLPREVAEYTNSMSQRINEAYSILTAGNTGNAPLGGPAPFAANQ